MEERISIIKKKKKESEKDYGEIGY